MTWLSEIEDTYGDEFAHGDLCPHWHGCKCNCQNQAIKRMASMIRELVTYIDILEIYVCTQSDKPVETVRGIGQLSPDAKEIIEEPSVAAKDESRE